MDFLDDISSALAPANTLEKPRTNHVLTGLSTLGFNFGGADSLLKKVSLRLENPSTTQHSLLPELPEVDLETTQLDKTSSEVYSHDAPLFGYSTAFDKLLQPSSNSNRQNSKPSLLPLNGAISDNTPLQLSAPTQGIGSDNEASPVSTQSTATRNITDTVITRPDPIKVIERTILTNLHFPTQVIDKVGATDMLDPTQVIEKIGESEMHNPTQVNEKITDSVMHNPTQVIDRTSEIDMHTPTQALDKKNDSERPESPQMDCHQQLSRTRILSQQHELEMDISNTTLTDDEQDLNPSAYVSSDVKDIVTKKGLEEEELLLNVQKRHADIRPEFNKRSIFSKQTLLDAFDNRPEVLGNSAAIISSNLRSSPFKESVATTNKEEDLGLPLRNPLDVYAQKLRQQLLLSPTGGEVGHQLIDLDSSDNEASIFSSPLKGSMRKPHRQVIEDIPALTKEQKLAIKLHFSKRKQKNTTRAETTKKNGWITALRKANAQQLKARIIADPNQPAKEELEKDEEIMGSLLEREMERVRNIRKQEKLRERAALQLTNRRGSVEESEVDQVPDSDDVPDSEYGSSASSAGEENLDEEDSANEINLKPKRSGIAHISDSDSESDSVKDFEKDLSGDEQVVKYSTRASIPDNSFDEDVAPALPRKDSYQLFQNLPARSQAQFQSQGSQPSVISTREPMVVPEFEDIIDEDLQATPMDTQATQADPEAVTVLFPETQVIAAADQSKNPSKKQEDHIAQDELVDPKSVREGLEQLIKTQPIMRNVTDDSEQEELPEAIQERIKFYEAKIRRQELKARRRRKEMEQRGFKNMVHGEAEESEDEWHGLGGVDGEVSDQANSEDERMIDNNMKIDMNDAEVRRKFMEQYQITDQQELEKLLDDVKNHRLTKRVGVQGLNIELSDEEDELLAAYRRQKWQEQQERLQKNKKMLSLAKNQRVKAFFDSIEETGPSITLDEEVHEDVSEILANEEPVAEHETRVKKTVKLKESFVQQQLSFLTLGTFDDGYERIQSTARAQEADSTDEDENENWRSLKTKSMSRLAVGKASIVVEERPKRTHEDTDEDSDQSLSGFHKRPSIVKSFKSFKEQEGVLIRDGNQFSGVTSHKEYRVALGSNASIARLTRNSKSSISLQ